MSLRQLHRSDFVAFQTIPTRWMDNDIYGHVNNVVYYSYFDTAANQYLIAEGGLDLVAGPVIGLVVESRCHYHAPLAYPTPLVAGVRVDHLGQRAVTYGIAIFADAPAAPADRAAAHGTFVHVFVDRATRAPAPIPPSLRAALARLAG